MRVLPSSNSGKECTSLLSAASADFMMGMSRVWRGVWALWFTCKSRGQETIASRMYILVWCGLRNGTTAGKGNLTYSFGTKEVLSD